MTRTPTHHSRPSHNSLHARCAPYAPDRSRSRYQASGLRITIVALWLLGLLVGCATPVPIPPESADSQSHEGASTSAADRLPARTPASRRQQAHQDAKSADSPLVHSIPPHVSAGRPADRFRPPPFPTAQEQASLAFARTVLDREAARKLDAGERERVARELVFAEYQHDVPIALSLAIIKQESRFDPSARGPSGSIGLMQLQPATAQEIAERTGLVWTDQQVLRNPEVNVRLGIAYLVELRKRFKNTEHAVGAYNIGPAKMRRLLARRPFRRGPYLTKVYGHAEALEDEYRD